MAAVALILTLMILLIGNTGRILCQWGKPFFKKTVWFWLPFGIAVVFVLGPFVLSRVPNCPVPRGLIQFAHYGLGVFLYTVMIVNLTAFVLCFLRKSQMGNTAALFFCMAVIVGLSGYGIFNARAIREVKYSVTLNREIEPTKIALVSDLHMGFIMEEAQLQKIADTINEIQPDLVCIAGDIFDGDTTALSDPTAIRNIFHSIHAPIYACLGNHDAGETFEQMLTFLSEAGIRVLQDEAVVVDNRLLLVGRRDASPIGKHQDSRARTVEIPADNTLPVVVLDHQPGNIAEYSNDVDLILCGHTHRGQLFPGNLVTRRIYAVDYGYYRANESAPQVIVTSGVGTWGPVLRIGSNSEVVEITVNG